MQSLPRRSMKTFSHQRCVCQRIRGCAVYKVISIAQERETVNGSNRTWFIANIGVHFFYIVDLVPNSIVERANLLLLCTACVVHHSRPSQHVCTCVVITTGCHSMYVHREDGSFPLEFPLTLGKTPIVLRHCIDF